MKKWYLIFFYWYDSEMKLWNKLLLIKDLKRCFKSLILLISTLIICKMAIWFYGNKTSIFYYAIVHCVLLCEDLDFAAFLLWFAVSKSISRTHEIKLDFVFLGGGGGTNLCTLTMHGNHAVFELLVSK